MSYGGWTTYGTRLRRIKEAYDKNAITSLKKLNKETSYTIGASDTQDVGLGEFMTGLHTDSQGKVINIHSWELWAFHPDGTSEITSGSG